ncbi:MAG TPA: Holliday junction resolvase RuvX [Burkholderiaceae bacterium]|nr:Holliday junction resolvase RuvX [Burkholderiaceae bacterium]
MRAPQTVLAFDFGTRRIGAAIGNSVTGTARPLESFAAAPRAAAFARIAQLIEAWQPDALVVGVPSDADPALAGTAARCRRFARQLNGRFGLPVHEIDERYSTHEAQAIIGTGGDDDAMAAAVILQQYLAAPPR